ncbi:hypothetical protein ACQP3F_31475, partial [Escherichia coli]
NAFIRAWEEASLGRGRQHTVMQTKKKIPNQPIRKSWDWLGRCFPDRAFMLLFGYMMKTAQRKCVIWQGVSIYLWLSLQK